MRTTAVPEHVDVLIVGAGLSGVGAACHLQRRCPGKTYVILEGRDSIGGTWDLFRYPGVRSDSDMHTLGYSFRPWEDPHAIADGSSILRYIKDTADDQDVTSKIRLGHRVISADWSSEDSRWTVTAERAATGEMVQLTTSFLHFCSGYYRYDEGYTPRLPGAERFEGTIVHPQHWPEELEYAGKRVVVIGSGATAVTLVPAMAKTAAHVTMLQRSPSYMVSLPGVDPLASRFRRWLPSMAAYQAVRAKNVAFMTLTYQLLRRRPEFGRSLLRKGVSNQLPEGFDVDTHFNPAYNPWDQRLCVCPDGDLFAALSDGSASVVTDTVRTFTERGIELAGGDELEADVIVTATGLNLIALGGIELSLDGAALDLPSHMVYKGMMVSGVPNHAMSIGYTNASWTLKCDLTCEYVCRLLKYMDRHGYREAVAVQDDGSIAPKPLIDLNSGYVLRSAEHLPSQGSKRPWRLYQNYVLDVVTLRWRQLDDGVLRFSRGAAVAPPVRVTAAA
ncbi:MAG: flavin-containing monooxygenase [Solirubrobacteraceae bacterium]